MILRSEEECDVEGQAQRSADDRGLEADGGGANGGARARRLTIYAWKAKYGGLEVNEARVAESA